MSRPSGKPFVAAMNDERVPLKLPGAGHKNGPRITVGAADFARETAGHRHPALLFGLKPLVAIP